MRNGMNLPQRFRFLPNYIGLYTCELLFRCTCARFGFKTVAPSTANRRSSWRSLWRRRPQRVTAWCAPCTNTTTPDAPTRTPPAAPWRRLATPRISSWTRPRRLLLQDTRSSRPACPHPCRPACTQAQQPPATWRRPRHMASSRHNDFQWLPTTDLPWSVTCLHTLFVHTLLNCSCNASDSAYSYTQSA